MLTPVLSLAPVLGLAPILSLAHVPSSEFRASNELDNLYGTLKDKLKQSNNK
jgi:hypothetical protein